jgi:DNA-directed RNA polymerase subunit RPC12/RpoP/FtsZ-binding cell division protein ZapB
MKITVEPFTYCAYCGKRFDADGADSIDAVEKHILECPKHPISTFRARIAELEAEIKRMNLSVTSWKQRAEREDENCVKETVRANRQAAEIDRLTQWVNDLQSGMYINCVYCGHRYGPRESMAATIPDATKSMADALREHIEQCPKHPMSKLKAEVEELKEEVKKWNGHYCDLLQECEPLEPLQAEIARLKGEVDHWRVKAKCYGDIVHGCAPALAAAGYPVDDMQPDGAVGGIKRSVEQLTAENERLRMVISGWQSHQNDIDEALRIHGKYVP